ncbi:MAG TPA: helix-turn-helix transcriptional regulator [Gammaproteobacteria bacterium]|nr:helix-turn-helix transcriptional regulator [Gammaproteobacteria bacterium]
MGPQRSSLIAFLKKCRSRLSPEDAGLPNPTRRRTPGLRREDVAALAGVSVTWYTWLEQGRDIQVSADVLERVCATLRMSPDEREYLFTLVQHRPAPLKATRIDEASATHRRMLDALGVPAVIMTARWDVIAWNDLTKIFRDYAALPRDRRNLLRILLVEDESYQRDLVQYEAMARRVLSKFRVDYSQTSDTASFDELIAELQARSSMFRRLWNTPEVTTRSEGVGHYPHLGGVSFTHSSYVPEGSPTLRLVIYVPHDAASAQKVTAWRAQSAGAQVH